MSTSHHYSPLEKKFSLSGKVAMVTGAAGQLGFQYAQTLLEAGANVSGCDIQPGNLQSKLNVKKDRLMVLKMDVTNRESIEKALEIVLSRFGNVDVLINNAAIDSPPSDNNLGTGPFETYPENLWDEVQSVNLKGMFLCCQVIGSHMAKTRGGSIINISSIYGMLSPDQRVYQEMKGGKDFIKPVSYSVSKAGVLNLTRYLATYWAPKNIRVNTLTLGGVFNHQDEGFLKNYTQRVPMRRMARQDEYNAAILFLASDASSYMTGSNLVIDGGYNSW